jgi:hypothetical protein
VKLQYISSENQVENILANPLSRIKFVYLRDTMGIMEINPLVEREDMAPQVGREK